MAVPQPLHDLGEEPAGFLLGEAPVFPHVTAKVPPGAVLHHQELARRVLDDFEEAYDVGMAEGLQRKRHQITRHTVAKLMTADDSQLLPRVDDAHRGMLYRLLLQNAMC